MSHTIPIIMVKSNTIVFSQVPWAFHIVCHLILTTNPIVQVLLLPDPEGKKKKSSERLPDSPKDTHLVRLPQSFSSKESAAGSIPRSGRSPARGHGNPLQHSCLENPMNGGPGGYSPWGSQSQTQLRDLAHTHAPI